MIVAKRRLLEVVRRHELAGPKTAKGRRKVDLPMMAVRSLSKHRRAMLAEGLTSPFVFCDTQGGPLRKNYLMCRNGGRPVRRKAVRSGYE